MKSSLSREEIAEIEVGHTDIDVRLSWVLTLVFAVFIFVVPVLELGLRWVNSGADDVESATAVRELSASRKSIAELVPTVAEIKQLEQAVDDGSVFRYWLLKPIQTVLIPFGLGNEQVYLGKDNWLFYRDAVDHVTGPSFLDPTQLQKRTRKNNAVQANPITAILDFQQQLAQRNVHLIVMPVPSKVSIYPEKLSAATHSVQTPINNAAYSLFIDQLQHANIDVFDPGPLLRQAKNADESLYLRSDTHWTPRGLEVVATFLARKIATTVNLTGTDQQLSTTSAQTISNHGDIAVMLAKAENQPTEQTDILPVTNALSKNAKVLLLGDSFANIYSLASMGWGQQAGLAERLAFNLQAPVDKIAVNGDGAFQSRQVLSDALRNGQDRLSNKKVVVLQFAARELSQGNWKLLPLELGEQDKSIEDTDTNNEPLTLTGTISALSPLPQPGQVPYRHAITAMHLNNVSNAENRITDKDIVIFQWGMVNNTLTTVSEYTIGERISLRVLPWSAVSEDYSSYRRIELNENTQFDLPVYWAINDSIVLPTQSAFDISPDQPPSLGVSSPTRTEYDLSSLQALITQMEANNENVIEGRNGWMFFLPELRFLNAGEFWGDNAKVISRASNKEYADPLPALADFNQQLKQQDIRLLVVPVPAKLSVHTEELFNNSLITDAQVEEFIALLQARGIAVLNLKQDLLHLKTLDTPPYLKTDTHWSPTAVELSASRIRQWLTQNNIQFDIEPRAYTTRSITIPINGDLIRQIENTATTENIVINQVLERDDIPIEPWRESPVLLMGDSHALVFHAGGDMFATGAGLPDHLAKELGFPIDLVAVRGSGSASTRMNLLRRRDNLAGKRVVIWCFTVREFTESSAGWPLIPVIRH